MEALVSKISMIGLGSLIDKSRDELIAQDKEFLELENKISELEFLYSELELGGEKGKTVKEYVDSLNKMRGAYGDISYIAGIKDAILILNHLGLLKAEI